MSELKWSGKVHPVAELFPMMTDDELNDLAEDIKANGLMHPLILGDNGDLWDGRNRMEGCRRAEYSPRFERAPEGADAREFIFSSSDCKRRNTTQGQRAMIAVMAYWDEEKNKLFFSREFVAVKAGVHEARISDACMIHKWARHLSLSVRDGLVALSVALQEAREAKEEQEEKEKEARSEQEKFESLRRDYPDLAAMVQEERLALSDAIGAAKARKEEEERKAEEERRYMAMKARQLDQALCFLDPGSMPADELSSSWVKVDPEVIGDTADFTPERARRCASVLLRYAELKENQKNG